jgi:hypothetical protein
MAITNKTINSLFNPHYLLEPRFVPESGTFLKPRPSLS